MNILIISPTEQGIGGIAQHVKGLSAFLRQNGHHVEIMSSQNTFTIPVKGLKNPSFMVSSFLKSKFKKNFDIVHAHNIPSALAMKQIPGKKILTIHGVFSKQIAQLHGSASERISDKFQLDALSWADKITVISKEALEYYSDFGYEIQQIPNGITIPEKIPKKEKTYDKQVIFAGRLSKEKGTETLNLFSQNLPANIDLIVVGAGPDAEEIKQISRKKNNIHFLGQLSHEKTLGLIANSDVLFQPSLSEGISTTILEAMAQKTCVLASNVGGNVELIENEKSGKLAEPSNFKLFLKSLVELFENPSLREKFAENAFAKVKEYEWNEIGKKYLKLYNSA